MRGFSGPDPAEYEHTGDSNEFGDGIETQTLCGASLFTDCNGEDWPAHQLIPGDAEALSTKTLELFRREHLIGAALDSAESFACDLSSLAKVAPDIVAPAILEALRHWRKYFGDQYDAAKAASIAAKERELKAQEEASPRVSCDNCSWTGRERDCNAIDHLEQRVAPGEIMPAGECPECGAVAHLLDEAEVSQP
jgi:hypothetical protein